MAYPGNPPKGPAPFEKAPLSPDDFERLATAFRPSWELDEAPFTGAGTLSAGDVRALQGGGTHADVRATAFSAMSAAQANHVPAKGVVTEEPAHKVILDPGLTPPPPSARPQVAAPAGPWAAQQQQPAQAPARQTPTVPPARPAPPTSRAPRATFPTEPSLSGVPGKSRVGLWVGGAVGAIALVGGVMWLASGSNDKPVAAPTSEVPAEKPVTVSAANVPPPPAETQSPAPSLPVAVAHPTPVPPVIAATALPQAPPPAPASPPPPMAHVATFQPPAPHPVASPPATPKPATASRPKGPTIVRDVPF